MEISHKPHGGWRALCLNLSDGTAPPRKLKVGGGQDAADAAAAAAAAMASCLPHVTEIV